jgi:ABC-2 type transport system permease protein
MTFGEKARLLRRMVAVNMASNLAYRGDFVFFMLGAIFSPLLAALIWKAAIASGASLPVDRSYVITYFVLLSVVSVLTSAWLSGFMADDIRNGKLSVWLARPGSYLYELVANNLSEKGVKLVILVPMVLGVSWFFRDDMAVTDVPWQWGVAVLAVALGAVLTFALDVVEGSLGFWLDDVSGIVRARGLLMAVLAGQVVPLVLMPEWAQGFLRAQPFRYLVSFPLEIMLGSLSTQEIAIGLALQVAYTVLFVVAARWLWNTGKRGYSAVGA